ncbi:unnamed protein product [Ectocarpus sp. CCAP 1310/34]|nr:unnamed protein product [Ectocarpus sp. CCAP 1310/34]
MLTFFLTFSHNYRTHLTSEAANAAETIAAPRTASGGRRRWNNSGGRTGERGERRKVGGTAAAAASVEQMEAVEALMLLFDRPPVQLALPAQPAQGVDLPAPMVPAWQVLDAAAVSQKLGRDDALEQLRDYVHYFSTGSPVRQGASSQGGVGVFATQPFEEQEVVMTLRRRCSAVSKWLAARRNLSLNVRARKGTKGIV